MGRIPRVCPRCASIIKRGNTVCPTCGMSFEEKKEKLIPNQIPPKDKTIEKKVAEVAVESKPTIEVVSVSKKRHKHKQKPKIDVTKDFTKDAEGKVAIDTRDVTFFDKDDTAFRSVKDARGDKIPEKLKWWEIYKWADRALARRKIKKEVNRASTQIPETISNNTMFFLCLFLGWFGIHSLYAKNYIRAVVVFLSFVLAMLVVSIEALSAIGLSVGGFFGSLVMFLWVLDLVRIIRKKYRFATVRKEFINSLNFETRAKLGRRYIKQEIAEIKQAEEKEAQMNDQKQDGQKGQAEQENVVKEKNGKQKQKRTK